MGSRKSKSSKRKSSEVLHSKSSRKSKKKSSHRDHSISSYSDDDSVSSVSSYSSSSDEDYRSRKRHSRSRAVVKSKKKRSEKRAQKKASPNQKSDDDSGSLRKIKRKKSRRKNKSERKGKPEKKRKRDASISDSLSYSSCQYDDSDSEKAEFERRPRKKIRDKKKPDKHGVEANGSRSKLANSLSSEGHSNFHNFSQKGEIPESSTNVRRLRSVITVVEHQPENDENLSEHNVGDEACVLNDVIGGPTSSGKSLDNLCINQDETKDFGESEKVGRVSGSVVSVNATTSCSDDLELILRQKALENLRKFRGKSQAESTITDYQRVKQLPFIKSDEIVGNMSPKLDDAGQNSKNGRSEEILHPKMVESKNAAKEYKKAESGVTKKSHIQQSDPKPVSGNAPAINDGSKSSVPEMHSTIEQASSPLDGKNSAMVEPVSSIRTLEEHSSKDQAEAKDGAQFQQKTMSVMRSGETVQVSYKVYIPKRAPALARRQLNR